MSRVSTKGARAALAAVAAGALILTGCSSGGGGGDSSEEKAKQQGAEVAYDFGTAKDSAGPAKDVDQQARKGGQIKVLQRDTFSHLDPAQIYVADEMSVATLLHRGLTTYKKVGNDKFKVVGDLATDSGKKSDGGKTWTYTLKDGVKWEDGSPITSSDLRHTFERQFADFITEGPMFVQQWFAGVNGTNYRKLLPGGPYKGKHLPDEVLETPDDKTIVFHFKKPQAELPYALAMQGYSAIQKKGDTKEKYDKAPVASGPYKVASFKSGKSMKLVRNKEWNPKTDPARNQYPNSFNIQFGVSFEDSTKRLMSDAGENQTAVSFSNQVDASSMNQVRTDPKVKERSVEGYQPFVGVISFNLDRLKNKKVRQAIAYALPAQSLIQAFGGAGGGKIAGNYISPTLVGHQPTDPFNKISKPQGDLKKAKKLVDESGKKGMKLTFAYQNAPEWQQFTVAAKENLEKIGFDVQRKDIVADTYFDQIGKIKNKYDLYHSNWGADWPSGSTVIPPQYDGRQIQDGASNYAHYDNPKVTKEIDRISDLADADKAAKEWMKLSDRILKEDVPAAPLMYYKAVQLHGSKIGGVYFDETLHDLMPTQLYVRK